MIAVAQMTGAEFDALPFEEGKDLELWDGEIVEVFTPNARHKGIVGNLYASIRPHLRREQTGVVYPGVEFALGPNLRLAPNLAILFGEKWRTLNPLQNPLPMAPDIAVEVISPSERTVESIRKVRVYLREGVSEVWQVFPETAEVLVHRGSPSIAIFGERDRMESPMLPGWSMELSEVFSAV